MAQKKNVPKSKVLTFKSSDEIRDWLAKEAEAGYRSLSAQIALIVNQAYLSGQKVKEGTSDNRL